MPKVEYFPDFTEEETFAPKVVPIFKKSDGNDSHGTHGRKGKRKSAYIRQSGKRRVDNDNDDE